MNFNEQSFENSKAALIHLMEESQKATLPNDKIVSFLNSPRKYSDFCRCFEPKTKQTVFFNQANFFRENSNPVEIIPSAGSSLGSISFRLESKDQQYPNSNADLIHFLANQLKVIPKQTLIIHAYPAPIQYPNDFSVLNAMARTDIVETFIKTYANHFECFVLVCQPLFLRQLIQRPDFLANISHKMSIVLGGTFVGNNQKKFIESSLPQLRSPIVNLFGLAEVSPGLAVQWGHEEFFRFNPSKHFVEIIENQLIVTPLTRKPIEIFRYVTGDIAEWAVNSAQFTLKGRKSNISKSTEIEEKIDQIIYCPQFAQYLTGRARLSENIFYIEAYKRESVDLRQIELKVENSFGKKIQTIVTEAYIDQYLQQQRPSVELLRKCRFYD